MKCKKIRTLHKNPAIEPGMDGGDLNVSNITLPLKELKFKAYRQDEPVEGHYFRLPKELFSDGFSSLSIEAKILYSILLDRLELSRKNGWVNNEGEVFLLYSRDSLGKMLNLSRPTITKVFKQLKEFKLIKEIRQGQNKPNIIYVGKIPDELRKEKNLTSGEKEFFPPEGKNLSPNDPDLNKPDLNKPNNKSKREFSGKPENSPPSQDNKNYSKWIRINTLEFPNSLPEYTVKRFIWSYKRHIGEEHPPLENQQLERCFNVLSSFFNENDIVDYDDIDKIIDCYFKTNFPNANSGAGCDYRFNHFATEGVLQNRFWEACY